MDRLYELGDGKTERVEIINRLEKYEDDEEYYGWFKLKFNSRGILIKHNIAYYFVTDREFYEINIDFDKVVDKIVSVLSRNFKTEYDFECAVGKLINEFSKKSIYNDFENFVKEYIKKNTKLDEITKFNFSYSSERGYHFVYAWGKKNGKEYKEVWIIGWRDCPYDYSDYSADECVDYYIIPEPEWKLN